MEDIRDDDRRAAELRNIVHGAADQQQLVILGEKQAEGSAVVAILAKAEEIGAKKTEAICQYARRPSKIPLTIVSGEILNTKVSAGLDEIMRDFSYTYKPPPSIVKLRANITAGETTVPVAQLAPILDKEIENGNLMVEARKALVLSLKHLHAFFKRLERQGKSWNAPDNKMEGESLVRVVFANLLFLLVRKKLKEIHNIEARRYLAILRQAAREAEGNSEVEAKSLNGTTTIAIKPLVLFDDFILNVLNQIIISWPHLAITYHLNNGVLGTKSTRATMPEILGSVESAVEFMNGPLAAEMAAVWDGLDRKPIRLSEEKAAEIRATGTAGPAPQPPAMVPNVASLFNRNAKEEKEKEAAMKSMFGRMFSSISGASSALVATITSAFSKRPRNMRVDESMDWESNAPALFAHYDNMDLNGVDPRVPVAGAPVANLDALARAVESAPEANSLSNAAKAAHAAAKAASNKWTEETAAKRRKVDQTGGRYRSTHKSHRNKKKRSTRRYKNRK